jgi:elongation factor Ts
LEISVESIKELRAQTGAGIMDCKHALEETNGNVEQAEEILRQQGIAAAAKKASRSANQGLVESYIHSGGRIGALVEVNCETDFVARTPEFREMAHDLAMQVAAMSPLYVDGDDVPDDQEDVNPQEACLMQQPFIKDPTKTIQDVVNETVARLGEAVRVRKFARFSLGE